MRQNDIFEDRHWLAGVRKGDTADAPIVGTAFAIDERHLLTCAHVVHAAGGTGPGARLHLDLPHDRKRRLTASVLEEAWRAVPAKLDPQTVGDVALLQIDALESPLTPLPITASRSGRQSSISSYGFPAGPLGSSVAEGTIGRPVGLEWIRIEQNSSAIIEPGFSGAPAWSDDVAGAIGMIVARDDKQLRAAYAIPIAAIASGCAVISQALARTPLAWLNHMTTALDAAKTDQSSLVRKLEENFIGRVSVFDALTRRLGEPGFASGYVFIEGDPGIGKSSVMAHLAATRGYPHHFNVLSENLRSPAAFLTNICAQLVTRYDLGRDALPPNVGENSTFLSRLLGEASKRSADPVVILVDALDEAEPPPAKGVNKLFLPPHLPDRCYVVATNRRRVESGVIAERNAKPIVILETSEENRRDIENYCRLLLDRAPAARDRLLRTWNTDLDGLLNAVWEKSEGNFMYVSSLLSDLLSDERETPNLAKRLEELPQGLVPYYERHWARMGADNIDRFRNLLEPIVCFMAVAKDAVRAADIADWMNASKEFAPTNARTVGDVLGAQWRQFVHPDSGKPPKYRIYHRSFLEFLSQKVDMEAYEDRIADALAGEFDLDATAVPPPQ